jgi:hypothetical protein
VVQHSIAPVPIPDGPRRTLARRLELRRQQRWPELDHINIRYQTSFAYIDGTTADGDSMKLCRLRYLGSPDDRGFAIYLASKDGYEDSILPRGSSIGASGHERTSDHWLQSPELLTRSRSPGRRAPPRTAAATAPEVGPIVVWCPSGETVQPRCLWKVPVTK